jgi:hypothetical protein
MLIVKEPSILLTGFMKQSGKLVLSACSMKTDMLSYLLMNKYYSLIGESYAQDKTGLSTDAR